MKRSALLLVLTMTLVALGMVRAQETTERYIPIGESPGVSGIESVIGTIDAIDRTGRKMVLAIDGGTTTVGLDDDTRFYVDRSKAGLPNLTGNFEDCRVGRLVEVRTGDDGIAEWVKVERS